SLRSCNDPFGILDVFRRIACRHWRGGMAERLSPVWIWRSCAESGRAIDRMEDLAGPSRATVKVSGRVHAEQPGVQSHRTPGVNSMVRKSRKSLRVATKATRANGAKRRKTAPKSPSRKVVKPTLLSGGNPQIAKGYGDAPVKAYIAALPGWKREIGRRLDAIIAGAVLDVHRAVKWNSPFYGIEGQGWFLGIHSFTKYIKVAFFRGASLRPVPPGKSKQKEVRYLDIREDDQLDEAQFAHWVQQASQLPGVKM